MQQAVCRPTGRFQPPASFRRVGQGGGAWKVSSEEVTARYLPQNSPAYSGRERGWREEKEVISLSYRCRAGSCESGVSKGTGEGNHHAHMGHDDSCLSKLKKEKKEQLTGKLLPHRAPASEQHFLGILLPQSRRGDFCPTSSVLSRSADTAVIPLGTAGRAPAHGARLCSCREQDCHAPSGATVKVLKHLRIPACFLGFLTPA